MMRQPIPSVTPSDIERIVRRDFPQAQFDTVMKILNEYGAEQRHREALRVQAAALKLGKKSVEGLRFQIGVAKCDYRDVLAPAEYPTYSRTSSGIQTLPPAEQQRIIEGDWKEYDSWFKAES